MKHFLILILLSVLLASCHRGTVYHHYESIPSGGWSRDDTLCFDVEVRDSLTQYLLFVEVRNRDEYPYRNLGLCLHIFPPSAREVSETARNRSLLLLRNDSSDMPVERRCLNLQLADSFGRWNGTGCAGLYGNSLPAGTMNVGHPGTYRIRITSDMEDVMLKGINDIGIKVTGNAHRP